MIAHIHTTSDAARAMLQKGFYTSRDMPHIRSDTSVTTAGLVMRRQRPQARMVFITLEDEFVHKPCKVYPQVYESYEHVFKSLFLVIKGNFLRKEGTHNLVITEARTFQALEKVPASKDWR